jgi:hypothetical protein
MSPMTAARSPLVTADAHDRLRDSAAMIAAARENDCDS